MSKPQEISAADLRCSFCSRPHADVRKLIAGPKNVAICDECVEVCNEIVTDTLSRDPALSAAHVPRSAPLDQQPLDESDLFPFTCPSCGHHWRIAKPR